MSVVISHEDESDEPTHAGFLADTTSLTTASLAALPTLILLVPCLVTGIWLLVTR
jgi:hypothetical protein